MTIKGFSKKSEDRDQTARNPKVVCYIGRTNAFCGILMDEGKIICDDTPDNILSSGILRTSGIREPLYITALKYAGVAVTPDMHPAHIGTLVLSDEQKAKVREWFERAERPERSAPGESLLDVKDVSFAYSNGHQALQDVSFSIRKGEMTAIAGRNGAGKSTMCKLICGFEHQQQGTVLLKGEDSADMSIKERAEHVGYVMQNPNQMICG